MSPPPLPLHPTVDLRRFWAKVDTSAGPNACWPWTGYRDAKGYGSFWFKGQMRKAHRAVYELVHGAPPAELSVMHTCDIRCCVNPAHLVLGTQADNMRDAMRKGRLPRGLKNGRAKVSDNDVVMLRIAIDVGFSKARVAAALGVTRDYVNRITSGRDRPNARLS